MTAQDKGLMAGKEAFMQRIASRLGRPAPLQAAPERMVRGVPDFYRDRRLSGGERVETFIRSWTALTGQVLLVDADNAPETIGAYLLQVCAEHGVRRTARWDHAELEALGLDETLRGGVSERGVPADDDVAADPQLQLAQEHRVCEIAIVSYLDPAFLAQGEVDAVHGAVRPDRQRRVPLAAEALEGVIARQEAVGA